MTTYEVSRETLEYNIKQLKAKANGVPIWAVVKGDGYGLGVLPLAEVLAEQNIHHFCVTELREAEILRDNGFTEDQILMLRSVADRKEINRLLDLAANVNPRMKYRKSLLLYGKTSRAVDGIQSAP